MSVDSVLKGDVTAALILIAEPGGQTSDLRVTPEGMTMMRAGEEYILFLVKDPRPNLPNPKQLERFVISGVWYGKVGVHNGVAVVDSRAPVDLKLFNGRSVESLAGEIAARVKRER